MPVHVAIIRRVRLGSEAEFEAALREFFRSSFEHGGVVGAHMLSPAPGDVQREYGILRSFSDAAERDAFYASPLFADWLARVEPLTEGPPLRRELTGLEAWFRGPDAPPRWKMALATLAGVYPTSLVLSFGLGPSLQTWPRPASALVVAGAMVAALTWLVMPFVIRLLGGWLHAKPREKRP